MTHLKKTSINSFLAAALSAMCCIASLPSQADAAGKRLGTREAVAQPIKDCTRLNARMGYYGNPWCTPAEQARWDRYEARRHAVR